MGVEPTCALLKGRTRGFEDRGTHRGPSTPIRNVECRRENVEWLWFGLYLSFIAYVKAAIVNQHSHPTFSHSALSTQHFACLLPDALVVGFDYLQDVDDEVGDDWGKQPASDDEQDGEEDG